MKGSASLLFQALHRACDDALTFAIKEGNLEALDAKAAARQRVLVDEIASITRHLEILTSVPKIDLPAIRAFEAQLRPLIAQRHGSLTPPSLSGFKRFAIDELYVPNNFELFVERLQEHVVSGYISKDQLVRQIDRSVVLGDPGAGKSTLSQKLCFDLATAQRPSDGSDRSFTPFLVVLRDYGAEKKIRNCSVLQFIEGMVNGRYQIAPPKGAVEYLLLNGYAMVIFDGLDELVESSYRREIRSDVESFCTRYPAAPVLVTSRKVGYEQAPLDPQRFVAYTIREFTDEQVKEYAHKWFSMAEELSPEERDESANKFLDESEIVRDLRSNPLILSLMCNIYRGENYIPRNRPGVYEKCALMLFDRWDRSRRIEVPFSFEDQLSPVMKHIAHWIFSDQKLQNGVTESELIEKATAYLHGRSEEDLEAAQRTARAFIEFCHGRAWIFRDTGTTATGEPIYQFTHRTFLEYFTAAQLVRTHATPEGLWAELLPKIKRSEWDVVAQLAFQLQSSNLEGAADRLLSLLLEKAETEGGDGRRALLGFGTRCLAFLTPSPKLLRIITRNAMEYCIQVAIDNLPSVDRDSRFPYRDFRAQDIIRGLFSAAAANRRIIADALKGELRSKVTNGGAAEAAAVLDILNYSTSALSRPGIRGDALSKEWDLVLNAVSNECGSRFHLLSQKCAYLSRAAYISGIVSAGDIVEWHGLGELFKPIRSLLFYTVLTPILDRLFRIPAWLEDQNAAEQFAGIGRALLVEPPPWVSTRSLGSFNRLRLPKRHKVENFGASHEAVFGIFCCLAVLLESGEKRGSFGDVQAFIGKSGNPQVRYLRGLLLARGSSETPLSAESIIKDYSFSDKESQLAIRWARGEINFVGRVTGAKN